MRHDTAEAAIPAQRVQRFDGFGFFIGSLFGSGFLHDGFWSSRCGGTNEIR
jgi:hypothetical protein